MKTIIAPIDFSDASTNALSFAAEIAKRSSARLLIVNILTKGEDLKAISTKLTGIETRLRKSFGARVECISLTARGSLVTALKKIIDVQQPSLIVMGTKGASGLKRILIGSNTVKVLTKIKVPVVGIPQAARFENFLKKGKNRVVLATDLDALENPDSLDILKEIALLIIKPKLRVLNVRPEKTSLDFIATMERKALLSVFQPEIESDRSTVFSKNVMGGINFYLNKNLDTGLVAMIARDSGQLIQKHYTREMASHTKFPLLVLHDVNQMTNYE